MPSPGRLGRLYRLAPDGSIVKVLEEIGTSNGMGFTPDRKQMYYTDTREREIYRAQVIEMGKPEQMVEKIAEGKLNKFFKESCLLNQQYVREPDKTIADYLNEVIAKTGERIAIKRFARFQIGAE